MKVVGYPKEIAMYQAYFFAIGMVFVCSLFFFTMLAFGKITDYLKYREKNAALRELQREKEERRVERLLKDKADEVVKVLPTDLIPSKMSPALPSYEGPIEYKGKFYASLQKAAAFLRLDPKSIAEEIDLMNVRPGEFDLWEKKPSYKVALLHRVQKLPRSKKRLVISDHRGFVSTAYVKDGLLRIPVQMTAKTGPAGDAELMRAALQ